MVWIAQACRLTAASPHAMLLRTIREAAMRAEGFLQAIMLRMDAWDRLLKSKRDG
jgi:hypothetical protein